MTEPLAIHSGAIPEPFRTSRARADQGSGNREHGTRDDLSLTKANVDTRASAREDSLVTVGRVIDTGLWDAGERHPVVRTGERDEIPRHVRAAVWFRDKGRCRLCAPGTPLGEWHLDHIKPWSAGGSDRSDNLRVLCATHNLERSNRRIAEERPESPVTWWCERCYMRDEHTWRYTPGLTPECPMHTRVRVIQSSHLIDPRCRVQRLYAKALETLAETGEEFIDWHNRRDGLTELHTTAYCAHCDLRGLTGWPL